MPLGKTIQIYLPGGNPRGLKIADVTSRTVQAILIPRSTLNMALKRAELENVGLYFLIGNPDDETKPLVYIGEAEDCRARLQQQNKAKDFWNVAIVIISKTKLFTKAHVKYLEWYCYTQAKKAGRYRIENANEPTRPHISEPTRDDLLDNFETIRLLVSTLGYPIFDPIVKPKDKEMLICKFGDKVYAEGELTEEGFVVFKGSTARIEETKTIGKWATDLRAKLLREGVLVEDKEKGVYRFTQDHVFSSPSSAAVTVLGRNANGWTVWKYKNGKTLDEVKRSGNAGYS